ncbi:MAG: ABC transporter permease [Streptosporangiaceae bacterium]
MRHALRRLGFFVLTLWACLTLNFVLPRLMPGSPILDMMAKYHGRVSPKALQAIEVAFGVDTHASLLSQYVSYLGNTARGDFGMSLTQTEPVSQVIAGAVWWTLGLIGVTTILAFVLGTLIGIIGAWRRGGWLDGILPPVFVIATSIPFFWVGMLLILLIAKVDPTFPTSGAYTYGATPGLNGAFIGDVLQHALLPGLAILITSIGGWILTMRNTMVTVLAEDYVRMARAKGLPGWRIMLDYAARNAMLPNLSGFAMSLGFVLSGAIVVEYLFSYQGVGYYLLQGVVNQDYALVQALFLLITVAVLVAVLAADILTAILDPRTRTGG